MAIKALIFDCFGVLIMGGRDVLVLDFPDKKQELHDVSLRSDYGFIEREEFAKEIIELTGVTPEEFEKKYWSKNVRNESMFNWLRELKKEGLYKVGLLSNIGITWLDEFLPEQERSMLFDATVLSNEVGMVKPDKRIFELTAQRLGVDPEECIMIDDLIENTDGAATAGMKGIVYGSTQQTKDEVKRLVSLYA